MLGQTGNQILFADLNGDGRADLIQQAPNGTVFAQVNQGQGRFVAETAPPVKTVNRFVAR
jgi:hypothetical protein